MRINCSKVVSSNARTSRRTAHTILDVERVSLTGEIIERQQDQDTGEWTYLIAGNTLADEPIIVVAKLTFTGKLIIITVYRLE